MYNLCLASCSAITIHAHKLVDADIEVTAAPVNLNSSARWATVTWKNVPSPSKDDWIGLWALWDTSAKIDPSKHAPVKYQVSNINFAMCMTLTSWDSACDMNSRLGIGGV